MVPDDLIVVNNASAGVFAQMKLYKYELKSENFEELLDFVWSWLKAGLQVVTILSDGMWMQPE